MATPVNLNVNPLAVSADLFMLRGLKDEGEAFYKAGNFRAAEECYQEVVELAEQMYGADDLYVAASLGNLGECRVALTKFDTALQAYESALSVVRKYSTEESIVMKMLGRTLSSKGEVLFHLERYQEALVDLQEALPLYPHHDLQVSTIQIRILMIKIMVADPSLRT
jgi:tetratricopeptide (TPR) repeat protein